MWLNAGIRILKFVSDSHLPPNLRTKILQWPINHFEDSRINSYHFFLLRITLLIISNRGCGLNTNIIVYQNSVCISPFYIIHVLHTVSLCHIWKEWRDQWKRKIVCKWFLELYERSKVYLDKEKVRCRMLKKTCWHI